MAGKTLEEALAKVEESNTVADSLILVYKAVRAELDGILAGNLPAGVQAKVDAVWEAAEAQRVETAEAMVANTPSAPE